MPKILRIILLFLLTIVIMSYIVYTMSLYSNTLYLRGMDAFSDFLKNSEKLFLLGGIFSYFSFRLIVKKIHLLFALHQLLGFIDTFEHEFSHLVMGLFHFKLPQKIMIDLKGNGAVHLYKPTLLIFLAPYLFSLWLAITFLILTFLKIDGVHFVNPFKINSNTLAFILGALQGNFLFRLKSELHTKQSDLLEANFFISVIFILSIQLLWISFWLFIDKAPTLENWLSWSLLTIQKFF